MLWLIWIVIMLAVPVFAGMSVWLQLNRESNETQPAPMHSEDGISA